MRPTRQWAMLAASACFFVVFAVVLGEPTPLLAAAGIGGWLLLAQFEAVRTIQAVDRGFSATVSVGDTSVFVGDRTPVTVRASLSNPVDTAVEAEVIAPPSVRVTDRRQRTLTIDSGELTAATVCSVTFPVAGRITFDTLEIRLEDRAGYFTETLTVDVDAQCLVNPSSSKDIHVGQGGRSVGTVFGSHSTDQTGAGLVPREPRQYVMGDSLSRIDWKTTARMNEPHVREFESESDYQLSLVVDAGSHMRAGPAGRTKHDYAREVALGYIGAAESYTDPVSAQIVGDDATIWRYGPSTASDAYRAVRTRLLKQRPETGTTQAVGVSRPVAPAGARLREQSLDGDSPFATTLREYFSDTATYVSRVSDRPVYEAVKAACINAERQHHLILVTDDTAKAETYEAVVLASKRSQQTSVFLTPQALFDRTETLDSPEREGFVEFEEFRSRLDELANVTAYEVAPRTAVERATADTATLGGGS